MEKTAIVGPTKEASGAVSIFIADVYLEKKQNSETVPYLRNIFTSPVSGLKTRAQICETAINHFSRLADKKTIFKLRR